MASQDKKRLIIRNNYDFEAVIPIVIPCERLGIGKCSSVTLIEEGGEEIPCQLDQGGELSFIAQIPPKDEKRFLLKQSTSDRVNSDRKLLRVEFDPESIGFIGKLFIGEHLLTTMQLGMLMNKGDYTARKETGLLSREINVSQPTNLTQMVNEEGKVRQVMKFKGEIDSYDIKVTFSVYGEGWLDIDCTITNKVDIEEDIPTYLSLVKRFFGFANHRCWTRWNGRISRDSDRFHYGDNCYQGLDWVLIEGDEEGYHLGMANDYTFYFMKEMSDGYVPCNSRTASQDLQKKGDSLYLLTDITGKSRDTGGYSYIAPPKGMIRSYRSRLFLSKRFDPHYSDHQFLLYAGYRMFKPRNDDIVLDLGVRDMEFGVNYLPHHSLAERFALWEMKGLEIVDVSHQYPNITPGRGHGGVRIGSNWTKFKDVITRDLKIINALGMQWVRLNFGGISRHEENWMNGYIRYYFEQCRKNGLKAIYDTMLADRSDYWAPKKMAEWVSEYQDVIQRITVQNEELYPKIRKGLMASWKREYDTYKKMSPGARVYQVSYQGGLGQYDQMDVLGMRYDCVAHHGYFWGKKLPPDQSIVDTDYMRNLGITLGNCATRKQKEPVDSETGWVGGLTTLSEDDRGRVFYNIFDKYASQRGVAKFFQCCWLHENFMVLLEDRYGERHYELLHYDRTPKSMANAYRAIIKKYASMDAPINQLNIGIPSVEIEPGNEQVISVKIKNICQKKLVGRTRIEVSQEITVNEDSWRNLTLTPGEVCEEEYSLKMGIDASPGWHHLFLRVEYSDGERKKIFYGWGLVGNPSLKLDLEKKSIEKVRYRDGIKVLRKIDFTIPTSIVYGSLGSLQALEWAHYIFESLHSVVGRLNSLRLFSTKSGELEPEVEENNLILVGSADSNPLVERWLEHLEDSHGEPEGWGLIQVVPNPASRRGATLTVISGRDREGLDRACLEFMTRYLEQSRYYLSSRTGLRKKPWQKISDSWSQNS